MAETKQATKNPAAPTQPKSPAASAQPTAKENPALATSANGDTLRYIPIGLIRENPVALRPVDRENEDYLGLVASIRKDGVLNPIVVREVEDPEKPGAKLYGLIDGLQRYNASLDAGIKEIPAHITTADQARIEEMQIIANAQKIETRPVQYAQQIARLLERNPLMTITELSGKLSKSTTWIHKMLGMVKHLHEEIKPLVDDARIKLFNATELAKLPVEEQPAWVDRAMTQAAGEFSAAVAARVKEIKEARKKGRAESPPEFQPVAHARKLSEVKGEFEKAVIGPLLVKGLKITDPTEAFALGVAWTLHMDPDSKVVQKQEHDAREKKRKEESDKRALERTKQKQDEAEKTRQELEKRIAERAAQAAKEPAPAPATAGAK